MYKTLSLFVVSVCAFAQVSAGDLNSVTMEHILVNGSGLEATGTEWTVAVGVGQVVFPYGFHTRSVTQGTIGGCTEYKAEYPSIELSFTVFPRSSYENMGVDFDSIKASGEITISELSTQMTDGVPTTQYTKMVRMGDSIVTLSARVKANPLAEKADLQKVMIFMSNLTY